MTEINQRNMVIIQVNSRSAFDRQLCVLKWNETIGNETSCWFRFIVRIKTVQLLEQKPPSP